MLWHSDIVNMHNNMLYSELIHEHHLTSRTLKLVMFEEEKAMGAARGYFAVKTLGDTDVKYFIPEPHRQHLPIKYKPAELKEVTYKTGSNSADVVKKPLSNAKPIVFRIKPEDNMSVRDIVDEFTWEHSCMPHWILNILIALAGFGGRTYMGICSESEFGKSSTYDNIHALTDKSLVFKPRSIPGMISAITETGNMVFDEVHDCDKPIKKLMEDFCLDAGGRRPFYQNGALKAKGLKQRYSLINQSVTFLYNVISQYDSPNSFYENIWTNPVAMDKRFVRVKLKGVLKEDFTLEEGIDLTEMAKANRDRYVQVTKKLFDIQDKMMNNKFVRRYSYALNNIPVRGRKIHTYNAVTMMIDQWAENVGEYVSMVEVFNQAIRDYEYMLVPEEQKLKVSEEVVR